MGYTWAANKSGGKAEGTTAATWPDVEIPKPAGNAKNGF
jgi:hypothetical protein